MAKHMFNKQQIELFDRGYKPAVLFPRSLLEKTTALLSKPLQDYHIAYSGPHCLLSHSPIPEVMNETEFGKYMGYYPPACDIFPTLHTNRIGVLIGADYSGVVFVAHEDMIDGIKEWCATQYPGCPLQLTKMRALPQDTPESRHNRLQEKGRRAVWDTQRKYEQIEVSTTATL